MKNTPQHINCLIFTPQDECTIPEGCCGLWVDRNGALKFRTAEGVDMSALLQILAGADAAPKAEEPAAREAASFGAEETPAEIRRAQRQRPRS